VQRRRRPSDRDHRYLSALIGWGYQPSDVERLILATAEPVEADATAEPVAADATTDEPVEATPPTSRSRPTTAKGAAALCEQRGGAGARHDSDYGLLCDGCAARQARRDEDRATFAHLSLSTFGFDPYADDPYD